MEDIITAAGALGKQIAAHERTRAFLEAARTVAADAEAQNLLREFQTQLEKIRAQEHGGQPVEPADKQRLVTLESQVASNEGLKRLMRSQADYLEMMNRVNDAIESAVQEAGS
jgi:cell fate (sporulation/competence/biofilm development) regulator YlbF (YheA/YmcA/DUF963 family)